MPKVKKARIPTIEVSATEKKVKAIIAEQLLIDDDQVLPGSAIKGDLGADPLDVIEIAMLIEESFDLEISEMDAEEIQTVQDAVNYVTAHAAGR